MFNSLKINNFQNDDRYNFQNYDSLLPKDSHQPSENQMSAADYLVSFYNQSESYCVGCVDIVNSTNIMKELGVTNGTRYQQIFLNSMSKILRRFGGFVIKNIGDCLLYYFPESSKYQRKFGFMSCIECCTAMTEYHYTICEKLRKESLPPVNYRISADYGPVMIMKSNSSIDMTGPPLTMCNDINHDAPINGVVIGGDLYERVKSFNDYKFKQIKDFSLGLRYSYPIYTAVRK